MNSTFGDAVKAVNELMHILCTKFSVTEPDLMPGPYASAVWVDIEEEAKRSHLNSINMVISDMVHNSKPSVHLWMPIKFKNERRDQFRFSPFIFWQWKNRRSFVITASEIAEIWHEYRDFQIQRMTGIQSLERVK